MNKKEMLLSVIKDFEGEFDSLKILQTCRVRYGANPTNVGSYLAKFAMQGMVQKTGTYKAKLSTNRIGDICTWIKTTKFSSPKKFVANPSIETEINPFLNWHGIYPEFFKQFPIPKGRVHKLEM